MTEILYSLADHEIHVFVDGSTEKVVSAKEACAELGVKMPSVSMSQYRGTMSATRLQPSEDLTYGYRLPLAEVDCFDKDVTEDLGYTAKQLAKQYAEQFYPGADIQID